MINIIKSVSNLGNLRYCIIWNVIDFKLFWIKIVYIILNNEEVVEECYLKGLKREY